MHARYTRDCTPALGRRVHTHLPSESRSTSFSEKALPRPPQVAHHALHPPLVLPSRPPLGAPVRGPRRPFRVRRGVRRRAPEPRRGEARGHGAGGGRPRAVAADAVPRLVAGGAARPRGGVGGGQRG